MSFWDTAPFTTSHTSIFFDPMPRVSRIVSTHTTHSTDKKKIQKYAAFLRLFVNSNAVRSIGQTGIMAVCTGLVSKGMPKARHSNIII